MNAITFELYCTKISDVFAWFYLMRYVVVVRSFNQAAFIWRGAWTRCINITINDIISKKNPPQRQLLEVRTWLSRFKYLFMSYVSYQRLIDTKIYQQHTYIFLANSACISIGYLGTIIWIPYICTYYIHWYAYQLLPLYCKITMHNNIA